MIKPIIYLLVLATTLVSLINLAWADVIEVNNDELEKLRADGVAIIDVRRQDEWEYTGLIEGSHPLTFFDKKGRYDAEAWLTELDAIVKQNQPFVLICARGVRSAKIADFLDKRLGYSQVHNVTKGILAWLGEKRAVEAFNP